MKHKTSELTGALLDAAVAMAEGAVDEAEDWFFKDTNTVIRKDLYLPSDAWFQGGPIIEREHIDIRWLEADLWCACKANDTVFVKMTNQYPEPGGPTALVASMRAFVASKFGAEIELP